MNNTSEKEVSKVIFARSYDNSMSIVYNSSQIYDSNMKIPFMVYVLRPRYVLYLRTMTYCFHSHYETHPTEKND